MKKYKLEDYKKFAGVLAYEGGKVVKKHFRKSISIESKSDQSPVTIADRKAEEKMRELIMKQFPAHGILGEEYGAYKPDARYQWILDPIDGTKSFICGAVSFGTLIALLENKKPLLGVFYQPILNELLIGDNMETELNGRKVQVRFCSKLEEAVLLTTDHRDIGRHQNAKKFDQLIDRVKLYRNWGDCYGYYLLATGFADIMIDPVMSPWDSLPIIPIVRGAGGAISDYQGNDPLEGDSIVASSPEIHEEIIKILSPVE
jgi:myo-inositol-1(or 4)-monophosphatase